MGRHVTLKGERKDIAEVGQLAQAFALRRDGAGGIENHGGNVAAFDAEDFVADAGAQRNLGQILGATVIIVAVEECMDRLDQAIPALADLHGRADPIDS